MSFPQGINFRSTAAYVTDGTDEDYEIAPGGVASYPHTTAQGNNVGWETAALNYQLRNRSTTNDRRLAGVNFINTSVKGDYRIDLDSTGSRNVGIAMGDLDYARDVDCELFDTSSSLGVLVSGTTGAANSWKDATDTPYTAANWPSSQTVVSKTFSTTICRFRVGDGVAQTTFIAHVYVGAGGAAGGHPTMRRWGGIPGMASTNSMGRSW